MKYKQPKFSNYKKFDVEGDGNSKFASLSKPARIAIVVVAAILALAILTLGVLAIIGAVNRKKTEEHNKQLQEIQITHLPNKRTYYCGNDLDITGLAVHTVTYGGDFTRIDIDLCTITGFDSSVPVEEQTITVTYKGFSDTFTVKIKESEPVIPVLESISMGTLPKTVYKFGETPTVEGGTIICTYTDGTTKTVEIKNEYVSGFSDAYMAGLGEHDITVSYTENGIQAQTTYKITITR